MRKAPVRWSRLAAVALASALAACGGGDGGGGGGETAQASGIVAQVASYELVAEREQRFIVGLLGADRAKLVSFGTVELAFRYLGTRERRLEPPRPGPGVAATFRPIPGQRVDPVAPGPRLVDASEGVGVYGADRVRFDAAGFWDVAVTARLDGRPVRATSAFEVLGEPRVPFPGDPAPRTANPLPGPGVAPAAVDSRARGGEPLPDPELHSTTIADAIAAGRPALVVISTPVYCQSRFCGPITDSVQALARRYRDRMAFVHIEVWEDFEAKKVSPAAAEWIARDPAAGAQEPWTFLVGADGRVVDRWDNVATDAELEEAVTRIVG
jgi:hypothetical protein